MTARPTRATGSHILALAAGLGIVISAGPDAEAQDINAQSFAKGGTFCFEIGKVSDHQRFRLVTAPASSPGPFEVIEVHAVEKGKLGSSIYVNGLAGTATLGPSSEPGATGSMLHVSLIGNGNGFTPDGTPELWTLQYSLELSPGTLTGKLYGRAEESGIIAEGAAYAAKNTFAVLREVKPISCDAF